MIHSHENPPNDKDPKEMNATEALIKRGVLLFAKEPEANPEHIDYDTYTLSIVEHDYPAKTPAMWNAVYEKWGINCGNVMLVGDTENISEIFDALRKDSRYIGGGVGVGFKDKAPMALHKMDSLAEKIGSVNFILKNEEGELVGYNTDGEGYAVSIEDVFSKRGEMLAGKKVVVLGAGGTGRAIVFALVKKGARVVILNRTVSKAEELAKGVAGHFGFDDTVISFGGEEEISKEIADADVVLNVSTKGASGPLEKYSPLAPAKLPATPEHIGENLAGADAVLRLLQKNAIISDVVLRKEMTPFLESAQKAGFETLNGIPMVVNQGVEAFWLLHSEELKSRGATKKDVYETMKKAAKL